MSAPLTAWIDGIGCLGPGLPDWPTTRAVLRGERPWVAEPTALPAPAMLPAAERRRASRVVKLTLAAGMEAVAAAGYWGIATRSMAPCQVLCAYDASFGAGLLDALAQVAADRQTTLLIAYDSEYPAPMHAKRDTPDCGAVALLLAPERSERSLARIGVAPTRDAADRLADPGLEGLRGTIPALRALPLLARLARGEAGRACLDYLPPMQLAVDVAPC